MFESLCRQTERLNDSRNEVDQLKQLLYKDDNIEFESAAEREQKLVDLLKTIEEEKETLLIKQQQLDNDLENSRSAIQIHNDEILQLNKRIKQLESTLDAKNAENKQIDLELQQIRDQSNNKQIEINRLKDLLENAKCKINELEQDRTLSDKSELDELLDNARKEKDGLEAEVTHLKEQLALSKNDVDKLKEQIFILQEECKVIRNNAKTTEKDRIKQLKMQIEKIKGKSSNNSTMVLSKSEEDLLNEVYLQYYQINPDLNDNQLTPEQKTIKKLKRWYDLDKSKQKPIAHKTKDKLAISKPTLDSVISNPQLEIIVKDDRLQNVEPILPFQEDLESIKSAKSLPNLTEFDTNHKNIKKEKRFSDIFEQPRSSLLSFETVDEICNAIPENTPNDELTTEQKLALRLKNSPYNSSSTSSLKKSLRIGRKRVFINSFDGNNRKISKSLSELSKPDTDSQTKFEKTASLDDFKTNIQPINMYCVYNNEDSTDFGFAVKPSVLFRDSIRRPTPNFNTFYQSQNNPEQYPIHYNSNNNNKITDTNSNFVFDTISDV